MYWNILNFSPSSFHGHFSKGVQRLPSYCWVPYKFAFQSFLNHIWFTSANLALFEILQLVKILHQKSTERKENLHFLPFFAICFQKNSSSSVFFQRMKSFMIKKLKKIHFNDLSGSQHAKSESWRFFQKIEKRRKICTSKWCKIEFRHKGTANFAFRLPQIYRNLIYR